MLYFFSWLTPIILLIAAGPAARRHGPGRLAGGAGAAPIDNNKDSNNNSSNNHRNRHTHETYNDTTNDNININHSIKHK